MKRATSAESYPTGPRTVKGKRISSKNALRHGFFSREIVVHSELWSEDRKEFKRLFRSYWNQFKPKGPAEFHLLEIVVAALWRLRRLFRAEGGGILSARKHIALSPSNLERLRVELDPSASRENLEAAEEEWEAESDILERRTAIPNNFLILQRYEAHILRVLYRALNELQRLQETRRELTLPPPRVVDSDKD